MPTTITTGAASAKGYGFGASAAGPVYVEDVFSTYLYTGTGADQSISNGIDLLGKGGAVWLKSRSNAYSHWISASGDNTGLVAPNATDAALTGANAAGNFEFNSTGFKVLAASGATINGSGVTFASWTFRKQPKFFDIVTYTGTGSARTISHNLGSVPGCIIVKRTDTTGNWQVYHRSLANTEYIVLNSAAGKATGTDRWNSTTATDTAFSLGKNDAVNANTGTYVAYLFAHDAGGFGLSGTDSVVKCGSYTGNGSATGPVIDLGWEPQFVVIKTIRTDLSYNWLMFDNMRGVATGMADAYLSPSLSSQEDATTDYLSFNSTGFQITRSANAINSNGQEHIYIAIRRGPMKKPTDATKVFYPGTRTGDGTVTAGFPVDASFNTSRDGGTVNSLFSRLTGKSVDTNSTVVEESSSGWWLSQSNTTFGTTSGIYGTTSNLVFECFRRAPGFLDVCCYSGTGSATTVAHNLGVVPEMMIVKRRGTTNAWAVYGNADNTDYLVLNTDAATVDDATYWNDTSPTSTVFSVGTNNAVNASSSTYVAYLFASCAGVSKVGSYTGTGTTKQIDCGFTGGARFVLIKRVDSTGDWYVWDTARGVVSGNDPYLLLNSTAAEVTNTDYIDPYSAGFEISSTAPAAINANGGTFIYLAVA